MNAWTSHCIVENKKVENICKKIVRVSHIYPRDLDGAWTASFLYLYTTNAQGYILLLLKRDHQLFVTYVNKIDSP